MSDDTDIIKKESPLLWAVLTFAFRRLETFGLAALAYWMAHNAEHKDTAWISQHLADKQAQIEKLKHYESGSN